MKIHGMLWDMGGVLVRTEDHSFRRRWERRLGLQPGELHDLVFHSDASQRASLGEGEAGDVWQAIADQFGLDPAQTEALARDFWAGDAVDEALVDFIRSQRGKLRTGLLSNAWSLVRQQIESNWQFADAFDEIMLSAEIRLLKPDPAAFQYALKRLGLPPESVVFVDDAADNVQAASALGMHSILFLDREDCLRRVRTALSQ